MAAGLIERWRKRVRGLARDERGNVALIFAFAAVPLMALTGFLVDYARVAKARGGLQAAVDGALIAAMKAEPEAREATARAVIAATGPNRDLRLDSVTVQLLDSGTRLVLDVAASVPILLSSGMGDLFQLGASAEAKLVPTGAPAPAACLLATDSDTSDALVLERDAVLEATGCEAHVRSGRSIVARFEEASRFAAPRLCLAGSGYEVRAASIQSTVVTRCAAASDPFGSGAIPLPAAATCSFTDLRVEEDATLQPGTYCGKTRLPSRGTVRLAAGTFVLRDGALEGAGQVTLAGEGVTIVLADEKAGLALDGKASVRLSAPTEGPYAGVLFHEPDDLPRSDMTFGGGARRLEGLVHLPSRMISLGGASEEPEKATLVVARVTIREGATLKLAPAARMVPVPGAKPPTRIVLSR